MQYVIMALAKLLILPHHLQGGSGTVAAGDEKTSSQSVYVFTITADIFARSLANFYRQ